MRSYRSFVVEADAGQNLGNILQSPSLPKASNPTVRLPPEFEEWVNELISSGDAKNRPDALRKMVQMYKTQDPNAIKQMASRLPPEHAKELADTLLSNNPEINAILDRFGQETKSSVDRTQPLSNVPRLTSTNLDDFAAMVSRETDPVKRELLAHEFLTNDPSGRGEMIRQQLEPIAKKSNATVTRALNYLADYFDKNEREKEQSGLLGGGKDIRMSRRNFIAGVAGAGGALAAGSVGFGAWLNSVLNNAQSTDTLQAAIAKVEQDAELRHAWKEIPITRFDIDKARFSIEKQDNGMVAIVRMSYPKKGIQGLQVYLQEKLRQLGLKQTGRSTLSEQPNQGMVFTMPVKGLEGFKGFQNIQESKLNLNSFAGWLKSTSP